MVAITRNIRRDGSGKIMNFRTKYALLALVTNAIESSLAVFIFLCNDNCV